MYKELEQEFQVSGQVIKSFEKQDALGAVAPAAAATCPLAFSTDMLAKARGMSNVPCAIPMLEYYHNETSLKQAVWQHTWENNMNQLINGPMAQIAQCVCGLGKS